MLRPLCASFSQLICCLAILLRKQSLPVGRILIRAAEVQLCPVGLRHTALRRRSSWKEHSASRTEQVRTALWQQQR
eukprot:974207-Prymnesium_polylepis.1